MISSRPGSITGQNRRVSTGSGASGGHPIVPMSASAPTPTPPEELLAEGVTFKDAKERWVATFRMLGWGALPLGAAIGGGIGEVFGLEAVFAVAAVLTLLMLPGRLLITDDRIAAAEADALRMAAGPPPQPGGAPAA